MAEWQMQRVLEICPIRQELPDDLFISCASFEERFLGVPNRLTPNVAEHFLLFRFSEPNEQREERIKTMEKILSINKFVSNHTQIHCEHGKSMEAILTLHRFLCSSNLDKKNLFITVDISTLTKDLLMNLLVYLLKYHQIEKLRLLYTIPGRYASPQEGWLSFGIKSIHIPPMCWNAWSPLKENLLIVILGFEEMRAWSLIDRFSADLSWVFVTNPGSKNEWDTYCEQYNRRLFEEVAPQGNIPALDPLRVSEIISEHVTKGIADKYNVFISSLGTKPQLVGVLLFNMYLASIPANIITTTVVEHNVPYYSWGIGDTFEMFFPVKNVPNRDE